MRLLHLLIGALSAISAFALNFAPSTTRSWPKTHSLGISHKLVTPLGGQAEDESWLESSLESSLESLDTVAIDAAVKRLELIGESMQNKADNTNIDGCWKLLYTSTPTNSQSPVQKAFTTSSLFNIFQVVQINNVDKPIISNVVVYKQLGRLRVTALAATNNNKKNNIVPRIGDGNILGFYPFGKSNNTQPKDVNDRINFQFDEACFEFNGNDLSIPYPVPFKLLNDESKGFIDVTYVSKKLRIAKGNKGTTFILRKVDENANVFSKIAMSSSVELKRGIKELPKLRIAVILPAQLGVRKDYDELVASLENYYEKVYVTPIDSVIRDWVGGLLPSFLSTDYINGKLDPMRTLKFYNSKVDSVIKQIVAENNDCEISLIGHSIGGWIGRYYISEYIDGEYKKYIKELITLGTPHSSNSKIDQTRGLLSYINERYPGSYEPTVKYKSVIGAGITGEVSFRSINLLAYLSYYALAGQGSTKGDGIIPVEASTLAGATNIVLQEEVLHSNYIPTPFRSFKFGNVKWYGDDEILKKIMT